MAQIVFLIWNAINDPLFGYFQVRKYSKWFKHNVMLDQPFDQLKKRNVLVIVNNHKPASNVTLTNENCGSNNYFSCHACHTRPFGILFLCCLACFRLSVYQGRHERAGPVPLHFHSVSPTPFAHLLVYQVPGTGYLLSSCLNSLNVSSYSNVVSYANCWRV